MSVASSMGVIRRFLGRELPRSASALRAPASPAKLSLLPERFSQVRDLVELYRLYDGMDDYAQFVNGGTFMPVEDALTAYNTMLEYTDWDVEPSGDELLRRDKRWRAGWWPFVDADGDYIVVDVDPGPLGRTGQVITFCNNGDFPAAVLGDSLGEWLDRYAEEVDAGRFELQDGFLWVPRFAESRR